MNQTNDEWLSLLRSVVMLICGSLATKGIITADQAPVVNTILMTAIPAIVAAVIGWWGKRSHSDENKVIAASKVTGIKPIEVLPSASNELKTIAVNRTDPALENVIVAKP